MANQCLLTTGTAAHGETWIEFWALGFSLAQPYLLEGIWGVKQRIEDSFCLSNKMKNMHSYKPFS